MYVSLRFIKFFPLTYQIGQGKRSHGGMNNPIVVPVHSERAPSEQDVLFIRLCLDRGNGCGVLLSPALCRQQTARTESCGGFGELQGASLPSNLLCREVMEFLLKRSLDICKPVTQIHTLNCLRVIDVEMCYDLLNKSNVIRFLNHDMIRQINAQ